MEVTRNIEGNRSAQFAQRYSRVSMRTIIEVPHPGDVTVLLAAWGVMNSMETKFLTNIAMVPGGGALRSMTKCLELATIIAQGSKAERNINHIKMAWDQLSAGAVA
ncbi:hypothetical protein MMA231_00943 [Asticcacaulis sp. MM231]|uniref:hypothetical protein n=1 Tax=Asticcacaulis sp. MM231 TaxID=3157666 RepID=UPI0032D57EF4